MPEESIQSEREVARERAQRKLRRLFSSLVAIVTGVLLALTIIALVNRDTTPELSQERADTARARWDANGPPSYKATIVVTGPQPATYRVVVRDGMAMSLTYDGTSITRPRVMQTWSVPGMFGTMQSDLDSVRLAAEEDVDPQTADLRLRAAFDEHLGYPKRYRRTPMGGRGEVTWTVTEFVSEASN